MHMESEQNQELFRCEACGATFRDADALQKHRVVHEQSNNKELEQGTQEPMQRPSMPPAGFDTPTR
jgi:DNA-directed RNA polymerase subunit M/transcription elongation factor TFIIS